MIVGELKPDRLMIFFESNDSNWICLRLAAFHYTLFKTDILDILEIGGMEVPQWLSYIISKAMGMEYRPIPAAPFPQSLPSLQTIRDTIPHIIEPGMAYPLFDGYQVGGLAINPGGMPISTEIPYKAKLRSWTFLGLNFWLQSGMFNGAGCLVSQALLYYQKVTETPIHYPLLPVTGYVEGRLGMGARIYHVAGLEESNLLTSEPFYAHNQIHYNGNNSYSIDRSFNVSCPVPEYPNGHFMRPVPGMKFKLLCPSGVLGRYSPVVEDDYSDYDSLDTVPFGCVPGWPSDEFLEPYGLYNDDSVGIDSFSTILGLPGIYSPYRNAMTTTIGFGQVVVQEELTGEESVSSGFSSLVFLAAMSKKFRRIGSLYVQDGFNPDVSTVNGEPLTVTGQTVHI
jgi:hypothetical protein